MKASRTYDLTFVAPHRRKEVLRRIAIIETYLENPTRAVAEQSAKEMGVNLVHLYNLARIWREVGRPEALPGAGRPRKRRQQIAPRLARLIARAVHESTDEKLEPIIRHLRDLAEREGVKLPGSSTVRKYVSAALTGHLPASSFAANSDWLIDHCVVDLPVATVEGQAAMPMATMLINVADAKLLAVVLTADCPHATDVARVLLRAISKKDGHPSARPIRIAIESYQGDDWTSLESFLIEAGFDLRIRRHKPTFEAEAAPRLLGAWKAGIRLRPRAARRRFNMRQATLGEGRSPLSIDAAEQLIQGRWEEGQGNLEPFLPYSWNEAFENRLSAMAARASIS